MKSCLTLKLYLNLLVYDQSVFISLSEVFDNLRLSSDMFEKCSETIARPSGNFWNILGKLRKTSLLIYLYKK